MSVEYIEYCPNSSTWISNLYLFWPSAVLLPTLTPSFQFALHLLLSQALVQAVACVWATSLSYSCLLTRAFLLPQAQFKSYLLQEAFSDSPSWNESPLLPGYFSTLLLSYNLLHGLPCFRFIYLCVSCRSAEGGNPCIPVTLRSTQHGALPLCSVRAQPILFNQ